MTLLQLCTGMVAIWHAWNVSLMFWLVNTIVMQNIPLEFVLRIFISNMYIQLIQVKQHCTLEYSVTVHCGCSNGVLKS